MAGLLPDFDDEPRGLLGGLRNTMMDPMFLAGAGLLTGQGFGGAMRGFEMGAGYEDRRRRRAAEAQEQANYRGILENPALLANLPEGFAGILRAAGPERGLPLLAKYADPDRALGVELQRANLAKTRAETDKLTREDPMTAFVMEMLGGGAASSPPSSAPALPPGLIPQSVPVSPGRALLQDASATDAQSPLLLPAASSPADDLSKDASGTVTTERVANPPRTSFETDAPPAWYQAAQYIPTQAAPQPTMPATAPQPSTSTQDLVQTPRGLIPREEARRIGNALLFHPKYSQVGKEFLDAARSSTSPDLAKPALNALQEKQLNSTEQYARLKGIEQSWKPEYQTIEARLGFKWNSLLDKFSSTRNSLTPQQRQDLASYSANRAEALNNLNQYIKEITGAAMTIAEAERIKKAQPNPGEGIFDGDSPIEFEAKMKNSIRMSKMALARYNYLVRNGFPADVNQMAKHLPLDDMPKFIQQRTNAIRKQILDASPGLKPQDVTPLVQQRLRAEFGIDA